jgi:ComF family protein
MSMIFKDFASSVLPDRCIGCGEILKEKSYFCQNCAKDVSFMADPLCTKCGRTQFFCNCSRYKNKYFSYVLSAFWYKNSISKAICKFKFSNQIKPARFLADNMIKQYNKYYNDMDFDVIIPVPLFKFKKAERGYNQSEILAKYLSKELKIPLNKKILKKVKNTKVQHFLPRNERQKNLKDAYVASKKCKDLKILLVDDIITTGATLNECAKSLKDAGAADVCCIVAAAVE